MRDCIYSFGVVWGWMKDGIRGKPGEDYVMRGLDGMYGEDLSVED